MQVYITIIIAGALLPAIYVLTMMLIRDLFKKEENQKRKILSSLPEIIAMLASEIALIRIWFGLGQPLFTDLTFQLLYVMIVAMTVLCFTDYWEHFVSNKVLLVLLVLFIIIIGFHALQNVNDIIAMLFPMLLGFLFCMLTFGIVYLFTRGSLGAGDVKLVLIMGLYLTSDYVVATILYACILSAVYSLVMLLRKKVTRKAVIPFVPFLYLGLIIRYLMG